MYLVNSKNLSEIRVNYNMKLSGEKYLEGPDLDSLRTITIKFRLYSLNNGKYSECVNRTSASKCLTLYLRWLHRMVKQGTT